MGIREASILQHVCIVFVCLWVLSLYNCSHLIAYLLSLIYLYLVHERYVMRLKRRVRFEERRNCSQRRVLSESESVRWLNYVVEKMWPICLEGIVSQKILLPLVPWFLDKYKPWTVNKAVVKHLYMGRAPPILTEMRVLRQCTGDDHLVLEIGMNFRSADDMSAILSVKLKKRLGFGMKTKLHMMGMHVEGKVLVGVKFLRSRPFLGRVRVCFVEPPYFQMTVKPIFTRGLDVTVLPGIAGWLDKLLAVAFEQTLVEPNMLVVDMEKFVSPQQETWFFVDEKEPVGYALVEIIEAADMKPSDLNGLADPYVKGQLGQYRFRTKTQWKTLAPKWHEEFKVPFCSWESINALVIEVRDKDHFVDDTLGDCSVNIGDYRTGERHDLWLPLRNIKVGRIHLAITVIEANRKDQDQQGNFLPINDDDVREDIKNKSVQDVPLSPNKSEISSKVADKYEPVDIEGQEETKNGEHKLLNTKIIGEDTYSVEESSTPVSLNDDNSSNEGSDGGKKRNNLKRGLRKIIRKKKDDKKEEFVPSPRPNLKSVNDKKIRLNLIVEGNDNKAKSILKHAGRGVKNVFFRKGSKIEGDISVGSRSFDEDSISSSISSPIFVSGELESIEELNVEKLEKRL